jgi:hypothetical protein
VSADALARYLRTFEELCRRKRWSDDVTVLRFVALTLASAGLSDPRGSLDQAAASLHQLAGWTSPLRSSLRHAVAATILRRRLDPATVHARVLETREAFRQHRLPRRGTGALLAALLLVLHHGGAAVPRRCLDRLGQLYSRWRDEHFWLTDANDLPAAALHALRDESIDTLGHDVERAYQALRQAGFRRGQQLQLVSQLLAADPRGAAGGVERFRRCAEALTHRGETIRPARYAEVALLALATADPSPLVERVLDYRDRLRENKPRPSRDIALSIAAGIALAEDAERAAGSKLGDLAMARAVQAILDAQQAAMLAAVGASVAATAAASH